MAYRINPRERRPRKAEDIESDRLIARFQAGDVRAFDELYLCYFDRVYRYLRVALRNREDAEDGAQQVLTQVLEALPRYEVRAGQPFRPWLFRVVRNYLANEARRPNLVEVEDPARIDERRERDLEQVELVLGWISDGDLLLFLEHLPLPQRQVLTLRYLLDLTTGEIARALDHTPAAIRQLHHRALEVLADRLTEIGRGPEVSGRRQPMVVALRHAPVLRARRFALW